MFSKLFYFGPSLNELHDEYAKRHRIDEAAPLKSLSDLEINAPPSLVWEAVTDLHGWSQWAPAVEVLERAEIRPDTKFKWKLNGATIQSTFAVVDNQRELNWTGIFFGFKAVDRIILEPLDGGGTRVLIEESLAGPLLPLLYSSAKLRTNHVRWLEALKRYVETKWQRFDT
jgi:hypothetical protein